MTPQLFKASEQHGNILRAIVQKFGGQRALSPDFVAASPFGRELI
jgi:hypothetical protein